jgi:hypothetical protein
MLPTRIQLGKRTLISHTQLARFINAADICHRRNAPRRRPQYINKERSLREDGKRTDFGSNILSFWLVLGVGWIDALYVGRRQLGSSVLT